MWYSQCINQYYLATQHWQVLILIHFRASPQMLLVFVSLYISFEVWFCSFYIVVSRSKANPTSTHRGTWKETFLCVCSSVETCKLIPLQLRIDAVCGYKHGLMMITILMGSLGFFSIAVF